MNVLIITHYIAPAQAVASVRWTKISKYLKKHEDVKITILTDRKNYTEDNCGMPKYKKDDLLSEDMKVFDEYLEFEYDSFYQKYKKALYQFKKSTNRDMEYHKNSVSNNEKVGFARRVKIFESFLRVDFWENHHIANAFYKRIKGELSQYDVVISTFSPAWTHLVASKIKKKKPQLYWVADFRDSYADDIADSKIAFNYHKKFVSKCCGKADVLFKVNEELVLFEKPNQKTMTITNGYDLDEKPVRIKPDKFSMVFTGLITGDERDFTTLFKAVRELADEGEINLCDMVFRYAGQSGKIFKEQAKTHMMDDYVVDCGLVSRSESLNMQASAAILLMANPNTTVLKCEWSGKMYEYMMAEKPIIYMVAGNVPYSLPSRNIGKIGGFCYEKIRHEELYYQLKVYILKCYKEWKLNGDILPAVDEKYVQNYSYELIAEKIYKLLKSM